MKTSSRWIFAKIVDDFYHRWMTSTCKDENITLDEAKHYYESEDLKNLSDRISGDEVILVETTYFLDDGEKSVDYFERFDNNYVIHKDLFREII